jgi:polysaccharide export outer membrane protein
LITATFDRRHHVDGLSRNAFRGTRGMKVRVDAIEMFVFGRAVAFALLSFTIVACDGPRGVDTTSSVSTQPAQYRLAHGDKVKVTVFNEPDFSGEFQVNDGGKVAFPMIGEVAAAGSSVHEFKDRLSARLRRTVREPRITVEVASYKPFNVFGEVKNSGQHPFRPGLTVHDAVALAGGYTYRANTRTAYLRRAGAQGEITVDMDGASIMVAPGDNVRVPERYF